MDSVLIDFLNDYYQADLNKIHDEAGNKHLTGYSHYYHADLFVKIFDNEEKFYAEQHVDQRYCPDIFLGTVIFGDNNVVVLRDRKLIDLDHEKLDEQQAYIYGRLLAEFHQKLTGYVAVPDDKKTLPDRIQEKLAKLTDKKHKKKAEKAYGFIEKSLSQAQQDYVKLKKVVLHGDFSIRNIMRYKGKYVLIDFERAHIGCQYEDFIKFFFSEVKDKKLRHSFIAGYQSLLEFEIPQSACQQVLLYMNALDIYTFHETHEEEKFGAMADDMLDTVIEGIPVLEI